MQDVQLSSIAVLLAAVAIAAPIARTLGIGTVLGYLAAGALVGPFGLGGLFSTGEAKEILHLAEFGVVLLLFLIGLELRPRRLWAMRGAIFGLGGAQVAISALLLAAIAIAFALPWKSALFMGLALALSSTAFALQVMEENGELNTKHGRLGFAVLLFQDLAAIPLIALAPLFAVAFVADAPQVDFFAAGKDHRGHHRGGRHRMVDPGCLRPPRRDDARARSDDGGGPAHGRDGGRDHAVGRRVGLARRLHRRRAPG